MDVNSIGTVAASYPDAASKPAASAEKAPAAKPDQDTAVVYEKSSSSADRVTGRTRQNSAIVAQLKAETEARTAQLQSLVEKMLAKQGQTLANADSIWSFLANGNLSTDPDVIAQAQKDVAEDGYWGAEQTSERILSFAKALANDDPEKADEMLEAFKKGYRQATGAWGKDLPSLCSDTYDLVEKKFAEWKEGISSADSETDAAEADE